LIASYVAVPDTTIFELFNLRTDFQSSSNYTKQIYMIEK